MKSSVRVRFSTPPSSCFPVDHARIAVLNWLYARQQKGAFVLRMEDLAVPELNTQRTVIENLKWLGLSWDEGLEMGGAYGPYRQSQRLDIYRRQFEKLKSSGLVYPCYDTRIEDPATSLQAPSANNVDNVEPYRRQNLESRVTAKQGDTPPIWLFEVKSGKITWNDLVLGANSFDLDRIGDFVVIGADGKPSSVFATAVDDHLMQITHVIHSDTHISNTSKQILLGETLGFQEPTFAHVPIMLSAERAVPSTSLDEFTDKGYIPEVLLNFLSLLGTSGELKNDIADHERLVSNFSFERMYNLPAVFDLTKLNRMNAAYIRRLPPDRFSRVIQPFLTTEDQDLSESHFLNLLPLIQNSIEYLSQVSEIIQLLSQDSIQPLDGDAITISSSDTSQKIYWAFLRYLNNYDQLNADIFRQIMREVQKETGIMGKELWAPVRVALTSKSDGPDLAIISEILGKEKVRRFVRSFVD